MPNKAQIHSVETLGSFRVKLIQYLEKASIAMDEVGREVKQTLFWMEGQQKPYWVNQVKRRRRALEEIQNEVFGAKLSQFRNASDAHQMALQRAQRSLQEAEEKLRKVTTWCRRYQSDVEPLGREVEKLQTVLVQDLKHGAAFLDRIIKTLEVYAERSRSHGAEASEVNEDKGGETAEEGSELAQKADHLEREES